MGVLYLVATPIGNLEDITLRALRILREVALIAAEDTRHSGKLLKHYGIQTPMLSYHVYSPPVRLEAILTALETGDVALISDAGMPAISDPGADLLLAAIEKGFRVEVVPGPSAVTAAVALSGLAPSGFLFLGFPPRRSKERQALFRSVARLPYPIVLYEAPHRLTATLGDLEAMLGNRPVAIGRELTKLHEEMARTTLAGARERFGNQTPRGEFSLVVGAPAPESAPVEPEAVALLLRERLRVGESLSAAAREVAKETRLPRSELYRIAMELRGDIDDVE